MTARVAREVRIRRFKVGFLDASKRKPQRGRTALLLLVSTIVALGLGEAIVRVALPYSTPDTIREYSLEYVPTLFTRQRLAPSNRLIEVDPAKAWGIKARDEPSDRAFFINDLGFRGPGFEARKPPGVRRVFVLGGSSVFDQNISDEGASVGASWPNQVQAVLRGRGLGRVEVINGGTPGHSSVDALARLYSELWLFEPDVVVLYTGWNDIKNFRGAPISPETPLSSLMRPFDPNADPFRNYRGTWDRLLSTSQLYVKVRNRFLPDAETIGQEGLLPTGSTGSDFESCGPDQFELNVRGVVALTRAMGATPVLATEATLVASTNTEDARQRISNAYQLLDAPGLERAFDDVLRILRTVAEDSDVPLLDLTDLNGEPAYFTDQVHLTAEGSRVVARRAADFLEPLLAR